ncbi:MAG: hypothetical protein LBD17_02915 [Endomicrobium sp.]|jgi:hypothetical protein|nr:hypothetical protein [Endomicrobium sp.]
MKKTLIFVSVLVLSVLLVFCDFEKIWENRKYYKYNEYMTDDKYWEEAEHFLNHYSHTPDIDKNTKISIGTELRVIGFYPDVKKTEGQYIDSTGDNPSPWVLAIAIGKSEFKIEGTPQELSKKSQIGILNKKPFFIVVPYASQTPKIDFYCGDDLTDPLVNEDSTGKRAKGFVDSLWLGYDHFYQIGIITSLSDYEKYETANNSEEVPIWGYYENSDYYLKGPSD